jgi:type I restriction enzyme R subunit
VESKLNKLLMQNPLRTDYQEHYEQLVKEYNQEKDRITIEQTFEALIKLVDELGQEENRAMREGLTEETLALFDLLNKPILSKKETERIKKVAVELLKTLKAESLKIANWRDKEATRDAVKQQIFDFLYADKTGLPVDDYNDQDIQALTENVYWHVYRAYPAVPSPIYN